MNLSNSKIWNCGVRVSEVRIKTAGNSVILKSRIQVYVVFHYAVRSREKHGFLSTVMFHFTLLQISYRATARASSETAYFSRPSSFKRNLSSTSFCFRIASSFNLLPLGRVSSDPRVSSKICISLLSAGLPPRGGLTGGAPRAQNKINHHE